MSGEALDWLNTYRLNGLMARRDPLGLLSLEAWERRSMEAKAAAEADPELIEARQKLEELQKKTEESNKKERNSQRDSFEAHLRRTTQLIFSNSRQIPSLCEPRSLYHFKPQLLISQVLPRWPMEVYCISERISHKPYIVKQRELLYKPVTESDGQVPIHSGNGGRLVYFYPPCSEAYFKRARVGESLVCEGGMCYKLKSPTDNMLLFESRFESGNLQKAVQVGPFEYELWLRCDLYTQKHTQWFYFRLRNMRPGITYKFTIVNLLKPDSLYNHGMKLLMYSDKKAMQRNIGWHRVGHHIRYYKNSIKREDGKGDQFCYSLAWHCEFPFSGDTCYFAHCYPYTYSDLQAYLCGIAEDAVRSQFCKQRVLCRTIASNLVHVLTITSAANSPVEAEAKRAVVVTARVHPGESNGSWMMKGLLDFLTGPSRDAQILRDNFVFKIVPMLNPDGVIVGNYRCSLAGRDLNRNYRTNLKESFPAVWYTKQMVKRLTQEREVVLYCDFHGHSRKQNIFIYGCDNRADPSMRLHERVFPMMLHKNAPSKFSFSDCSFKVQKSKEGTGRIVMWREMGIMNSYTMEATFCGSTLDHVNGYHFSTADLEAMGYHFCDTLLDYCDPDRTKYELVLHEVEEKAKAEILAKLAKMGKELPPDANPLDILLLDSDFSSGADSSDGGSDSSVSDGPPVHVVHSTYCSGDIKRKKKKRRSRTERIRRRSRLKLHHSSGNDRQAADSHPRNNEPSFAPLTERDIVSEDRSTRSSNKRRKDSTLRLTNAQQLAVPSNVEERLEDRHLRGVEYLGSLTDEYIRSGLLITSANPSSTKQKGSGPIAASLAGVVEDRLSGRVMISGYSLADKTENAQTVVQAMDNARGARVPRLGSSFGPRSSMEPSCQTNSQGPGAFTARYVSHHLTSESGTFLSGSRVRSGITTARPATAIRSRTSLSQPLPSRSGSAATVSKETTKPGFEVSDIVKRRTVRACQQQGTTTIPANLEQQRTDNDIAASSSVCSMASAVPLDQDGLQFLVDRMRDIHVSEMSNSLQSTRSSNLTRSGLFKKQLQAVKSVNTHSSSRLAKNLKRHLSDTRGGFPGRINSTRTTRLDPIHPKPGPPSYENGNKEHVSGVTPPLTGRLSKISAVGSRDKLANRGVSSRDKLANHGRIEEHKNAIAAAVRDREDQQRQSVTNIKELSSGVGRNPHKTVETAPRKETLSKENKRITGPRIRKSVSEPIGASPRSGVRKNIAQSETSLGDREIRKPAAVHGYENQKQTNLDDKPTVAFVDGNERVMFPAEAGGRLVLQRREPMTSSEATRNEPLEPPSTYKVGPKPTAATGTPTPTVALTIETSDFKVYKARKKMPQLRPYLLSSHGGRNLLNTPHQRDGEG